MCLGNVCPDTSSDQMRTSHALPVAESGNAQSELTATAGAARRDKDPSSTPMGTNRHYIGAEMGTPIHPLHGGYTPS